MTYTGAMVLPHNAVVMKEAEMRYIEGGATSTWVAKASAVRKRLNSFIYCAGRGSSLASCLTGLFSAPIISDIISNFTLGGWFNSYKDNALIAYGQSKRYGDKTKVKLKITTNRIYKCTGMYVTKA